MALRAKVLRRLMGAVRFGVRTGERADRRKRDCQWLVEALEGRMLLTVSLPGEHVLDPSVSDAHDSGAVIASASSDDYPYKTADWNQADPWLFFYRECTSFVAWRMNRDHGATTSPYWFTNYMMGGHWGNASNWATNAQSLGFDVDTTPRVGAIAHFDYGHVAYVESVNSDGSVNVSEYNYHLDHNYDTRSNIRADRYIHVNDTVVSLPGPTITSPGTVSDTGYTVSNLTPTMYWNQLPAATKYGLYISQSPYGSSNIIYQNQNVPVSASFTLPAGALQNGVKYRWNMTAFNAAGEGLVNNTLYFQTPAAPNQRPTIGSFSASPNPLTQGGTLTLTATSVADSDGTVGNVKFYWDTDSNGVLNTSIDALMGTDTSSSGGWTASFTADLPAGTNRFFARAQDNDLAWSDVASVTVAVNGGSNQPPTIVSLSASPNPLTQGGTLTLTANSVADGDGTVGKVEFYWDSDNNGLLNTSADSLLGTDTSSSGGWTVSFLPGLPTGTNRFFARAQDNSLAWSNTASVTVSVNGSSGGDTGIDLVPSDLYLKDLSGNRIDQPEVGQTVSVWDTVLLQMGTLDLGGAQLKDTVQLDGADWTYTLTTWTGANVAPTMWNGRLADWVVTPGTHTFRLSVDTTDLVQETDEQNNILERSFTAVGLTDQAPAVNAFTPTPSTATVGQSVALSVTASDQDAGDSISAVKFFDGATLLGSGSLSAGQWTCNWDTGGHATGTFTITAFAYDNDATPSAASTTSVTINPLVGPTMPDLAGITVSAAPTTALAGDLLTVNRSFKVSGAAVGPDFRIEYRLSADRLWGNADDILIAQYETITQAVGKSIGSHSGTFNFTVPLANAGSYYLLAKVDSTNTVTESNESNNAIVGSLIKVTPPANDAFASRSTIVGVVTSVSGTNANATKETGEPAHAGYAGGKSVWWTWTPAYTGRAQIDTLGSSFNTLLGVYAGTNVSKLSYVASNNDISATSIASSVAFSAVRGQAYQIAVDGYAGLVGSIKLNINLTAGVLDDKQAVLTNSSLWKPIKGQEQGQQLYSAPGSGANTATWTFSNLLAGTYRLSATWLGLSSAASNAPFSIYYNNTLLTTVAVNQKVNPKGSSLDGAIWQTLGAFKISSGSLTIKLTNNANGYVLADGVRFEKIG